VSSETLGFIGLGSIGAPMAANLVAAGHRVVGFDVAGTGERLPSGAVAANSVEETAAQVDTLFMSLPNGTASKAVCSQLAGAERQQAHIIVEGNVVMGKAPSRNAKMAATGGGTRYTRLTDRNRKPCTARPARRRRRS
jgi:3-hydroxyisobutyrate dehydrogenase-like beta-hydroxyacid dehydrogenase